MFPLILGLLSVLGYGDAGRRARRRPRCRRSSGSSRATRTPSSQTCSLVQQNSRRCSASSASSGCSGAGAASSPMEFSLGVVIGVRQRSFLRQRAMALAMTILFVVALVITVSVNSLIALPGVVGFRTAGGAPGLVRFMLAIFAGPQPHPSGCANSGPGSSSPARRWRSSHCSGRCTPHFSKALTYGKTFRAGLRARELAVLPGRVHPARRRRQPPARR